MNLFKLFKSNRSSAPVARERLQILLAHERAISGGVDLMATLKEEILEVIARHFPLERDKVQFQVNRGDRVSMLEIEIEVPTVGRNTPPGEARVAIRG